jgi:hypothetical protein
MRHFALSYRQVWKAEREDAVDITANVTHRKVTDGSESKPAALPLVEGFP